MNNLRLVDAMEIKLNELRDKNFELNRMTKMFEKSMVLKVSLAKSITKL